MNRRAIIAVAKLSGAIELELGFGTVDCTGRFRPYEVLPIIATVSCDSDGTWIAIACAHMTGPTIRIRYKRRKWRIGSLWSHAESRWKTGIRLDQL